MKCTRWKNGRKVHRGCRNDAFTQPDYKLPLIQLDSKYGEYLVVDKPFDLVLNSDDKSEWNVLDLLNRDYAHLLQKSSAAELCSQQKQDNEQELAEVRSFKYCHLIDFETSGICVVATTRLAASAIAQAFAQREVEKYYVMLVYGHVNLQAIWNKKKEEQQSEQPIANGLSNDSQALTITTYIKRSGNVFRGKKLKQITSMDPLSKDPEKTANAISKFTVLAHGTYREQDVTLLGAKILTGRRHQLRLHCSYMEHPIVGDGIYGNRSIDRLVQAQRTMLHSYYIKILVQTDCYALKRGEYIECRTPELVLDQYFTASNWYVRSKNPEDWNL
jgi:23S rRNA-/tRNA-specific pseudouridylate synthase